VVRGGLDDGSNGDVIGIEAGDLDARDSGHDRTLALCWCKRAMYVKAFT